MSRRETGSSVSIQMVTKSSLLNFTAYSIWSGRIPVIIDNNQSPSHPVMETSAELLYLLDKYDKENQFKFESELEQSELVQWLFFWHGSGAPYQGNLSFFKRAQEQSSCKFKSHRMRSKQSVWRNCHWIVAISRFRKETYRVFSVLEIQLSGRYTGEPKEYLAGKGKGKYSVADIGTWAWVKNWPASGYTDEEMKEFPYLLKWVKRIAERPAVQRGIGMKYKLLWTYYVIGYRLFIKPNYCSPWELKRLLIIFNMILHNLIMKSNNQSKF